MKFSKAALLAEAYCHLNLRILYKLWKAKGVFRLN